MSLRVTDKRSTRTVDREGLRLVAGEDFVNIERPRFYCIVLPIKLLDEFFANALEDFDVSLILRWRHLAESCRPTPSAFLNPHQAPKPKVDKISTKIGARTGPQG